MSLEDSIKRVQNRAANNFATNDKGRRNFHGAFTGGFSAGYFNSVGSKEGLTLISNSTIIVISIAIVIVDISIILQPFLSACC